MQKRRVNDYEEDLYWHTHATCTCPMYWACALMSEAIVAALKQEPPSTDKIIVAATIFNGYHESLI